MLGWLARLLLGWVPDDLFDVDLHDLDTDPCLFERDIEP